MERPTSVTILVFLAALLAFLNAIAMLRFLGFLPSGNVMSSVGVRCHS